MCMALWRQFQFWCLDHKTPSSLLNCGEGEPLLNAMHHWDDPEGWDEESGGRGVQDGEHM